MKRTPEAWIAWRYLVSKKSHSAVGAISVVSICGMAIATAAIICVLSVFNGFKEVIGNKLDNLSPDIMVTPVKGKVFSEADSIASAVSKIEGVAKVMPVLTDNALAICGVREMPITLKGVNISDYRRNTAIDSLIIDKIAPGTDSLSDGTAPAVFSVGAASGLGTAPGEHILLFTPVREGRVNLANPASSFIADSVTVSNVYRSDQSRFDEDLVLVDLQLARDLLQYDTDASSLEIKLVPGADMQRVRSRLSKLLGPEFIVKDRLMQQEIDFRMISIEKWVTFLLLFFILIIASFNIISSLSMLVIEKEKSNSTLRSLGFSKKRIGGIFFWESIFVTLAGGISGIILGVILTLLQEHFGFIHIHGDPSSLIVTSYPVHLEPGDILLTSLPILVIGIVTALITASFARNRLSRL